MEAKGRFSVNKVALKSQTVPLNMINSDKDTAHSYNNFFYQQILNLHKEFPSSTLS